MIRVEEAEKIILSQVKDFGTESIPFETSLGRVLAEDLHCRQGYAVRLTGPPWMELL